ncbi:hypothetical protein [Nocardiopsis metallicus]|uniref:Uncharacterized protein n=1 Tax=Nocardiopsis metallicus TaxID=179819 RepID=A0A840W4H0_9ACTN|nr:hypothetical protein [Nocardiopsis metallicus]MBB5490962.1 hypothetical protein [Nocardiopsis metallicus]
MRYNCSEATAAALRSAVANLSIRTRRWGVDDPRTIEARSEWNRLRTLALLETAEDTFSYLATDDRTRFARKLTEAGVA